MFHRAILAAAGVFAATLAHAQDKLSFALDWKFEGPSAPYFLSIDNGHFSEAGLDVEIAAGQGSLDAIPKVATGRFRLDLPTSTASSSSSTRTRVRR